MRGVNGTRESILFIRSERFKTLESPIRRLEDVEIGGKESVHSLLRNMLMMSESVDISVFMKSPRSTREIYESPNLQ